MPSRRRHSEKSGNSSHLNDAVATLYLSAGSRFRRRLNLLCYAVQTCFDIRTKYPLERRHPSPLKEILVLALDKLSERMLKTICECSLPLSNCRPYHHSGRIQGRRRAETIGYHLRRFHGALIFAEVDNLSIAPNSHTRQDSMAIAPADSRTTSARVRRAAWPYPKTYPDRPSPSKAHQAPQPTAPYCQLKHS